MKLRPTSSFRGGFARGSRARLAAMLVLAAGLTVTAVMSVASGSGPDSGRDDGSPALTPGEGSALSGPASRVPPGWRAFAVPADDRTPPLVLGDHVVAYAAPESPSPDLLGDTTPLATDGVVVDTTEHAVTIAVSRESASDLASALAQGQVVLALRGPDRQP